MGGFHDPSTLAWREVGTVQIPLPLGSFYLLAGTPLAAFADGATDVPGLALDNSEAAGIRWNNHAAPLAIGTAIVFPGDRQPGTDVVLHIVASKTGATSGDAVTFTVGAFFHPVAALRDADADAGGASTAMTGAATSKTVQKVTRTIASADVPTGPVPLTLTVKPTAGTLGTDDVTINAMYLEYSRVLSPA